MNGDAMGGAVMKSSFIGQWQQSRAVTGLFLCFVALVIGCKSSEETPESIEAVDVPPLLTVDIEEDIQEAQRAPELAGVLPGDFPADLPIYAPSSLVDYGSTDSGQGLVQLFSPHSPQMVEEGFSKRLRDQGWSMTPGSASSFRLEKGDRRLRLIIEESDAGANFRIEY